MAWNPAPEVADCRELARKWGKEQIIVLAIDNTGRVDLVTFGKTKRLCDCAYQFGLCAHKAVELKIANACRDVAKLSAEDAAASILEQTKRRPGFLL